MLPRGQSDPYTLVRVIEFAPELCMHCNFGDGVHPVLEPLLAGGLEVNDDAGQPCLNKQGGAGLCFAKVGLDEQGCKDLAQKLLSSNRCAC